MTPNRMLLDVSVSSKKKRFKKHLILIIGKLNPDDFPFFLIL